MGLIGGQWAAYQERLERAVAEARERLVREPRLLAPEARVASIKRAPYAQATAAPERGQGAARPLRRDGSPAGTGAYLPRRDGVPTVTRVPLRSDGTLQARFRGPSSGLERRLPFSLLPNGTPLPRPRSASSSVGVYATG